MADMPIGFAVIKEMTKEEMIDEILAGQRARMMEESLPQVRAMVVNYRLDSIKRTLIAEAGLKESSLGSLYTDTEDE